MSSPSHPLDIFGLTRLAAESYLWSSYFLYFLRHLLYLFLTP